jgi:4-amino-4-deoxy-L-arabinose transferase-like glycosyltransferase
MLGRRFYFYAVAGIFVLALALRLFFAFQAENLDLDAYFSYRQVESIKTTLSPSYIDGLSYSGRIHIFPPVYYYILAFFSFISGTVLALKIVPNLLACSLIIIVYLMVFELTKRRSIALFSAFVSAFIPVFFADTINSASIYSFTIPLIFYLIYCFMRIKERIFLYQFLALSLVLSLASTISFLFIFALIIYLLLVKLEFAQQNRAELESILFVTFLTLWVNILMYKKAFLFHSRALIWQNLPPQIIASYFREVNMLESITNVGLIPIFFGIYAIYRYMFKERDKRTYLLMAFALSVSLLLWFRLITLDVGLMFLGTLLVPLLGQALGLLFSYIEKTRISSHAWAFWLVLVLLFVFSSVFTSLSAASEAIKGSVSSEEMSALLWLRESAPEGSVVLSTISEGELISAVAQRKNVADTDFILIRSSDIVFDEVRQMYTSFLKTDAVELMNKYDVDYVYFSPRAREEFNISELQYADKDCFELVYDKEVKIYRSLCEVRV